MYFVHGFNRPYVVITIKYKHMYFGLTKTKNESGKQTLPPLPLTLLAPRLRATARDVLFSDVFR